VAALRWQPHLVLILFKLSGGVDLLFGCCGNLWGVDRLAFVFSG
jgi:hypothetical protein